MGFWFERRAVSRKARRGLRSLFGKAPDAEAVSDRLGRLLPRMWKDAEVIVAGKRIAVAVHPHAPVVRIKVAADGAIELRASLAEVGPGLYDRAIARVSPALDELDYDWEPAADARTDLLAWLVGELRAGATQIGMPEGRVFLVDAPIQTATGPRDAAWRDAVLADPGAGRDAFAWWEDAPGHEERSRAILALWHDVAWREPLEKTERATMKRVDADLRAARKADRALDLPYAAWAELVGHLGDDERAAELRARATGAAAIGYRRFEMITEIGDGWSLTLPGSFVGRWENERYWATDGGRTIELSTLETTVADSAALLDVAEPRHPVIERLADGNRLGRAEVYDVDHTHVVHGIVAVAPRVAILTCKGSQSDEPWALATWRSLRNAGA